MKKVRILSLILALTMMLGLCACGSPSESLIRTQEIETTDYLDQTSSESQSSENYNDLDEEKDLTSGTPWLASSCQGVISEDTPINPKDDFFLFVNKDSIINYEIEPGYSSAGTLNLRSIQNDKDILDLFTEGTEAKSRDAKLATDLYNLFLDWDSRNKLGFGLLAPDIEAIEKIQTIDELAEFYAGTPLWEAAAVLCSVGDTTDLDDSSKRIIFVSSTPLFLGDSAEYENLTEVGQVMKSAQQVLFSYMLTRFGYCEEEAQKKIDNCYKYEELLAPSIYTSEECNQPDFINIVNNHVTYEELEKLQGNVPIIQMLDTTGYERKETVIVENPAGLEALRDSFVQDNLEIIKDYLIVHSIISCSQTLDQECFEKVIEYSNTIYGSEGRLSDEEYASSAVSSYLAWQTSRLYCEKYVTENDKQTIEELCYAVLDSYEELIKESDFLSEETRNTAIEKLHAILVNSLYPDDWSKYTYDTLQFKSKEEGGSYFEAIKAIDKAAYEKSVEKFSKPVDRSDWDVGGIYPTTVNAFYNPQNNSVNILAAFCQGDVYYPDMTVEELYGKIGMVVAHEISHSFDGTGSQFDKDGNVHDWWTPEDREKFAAKIQALAEYADAVYCWDGTHINGSISTGEMCADMGGAAAMLQMAKSIEDFDYDKFFKGYADFWSSVYTYNTFLANLKDTHPPTYFRVNGTVQQFDEFLKCYDIKEGDRMYLDPENRVAIW